MIEHYICPRIGAVPLRRLRVDHLDQLYADLLVHGGLTGTASASKTVYDVHVIVRSALADATRRQLVDVNVALPPKRHDPNLDPAQHRDLDRSQLRVFLNSAQHLRLYPALHLAAMTGMRRGELAGLRWGDCDHTGHRLSVARSRQSVAGRSVEVAVKTRTSRRCVDLDAATEVVLAAWRRPPRTRRTSRRARRRDVHEHRRAAGACRVDQPAVRPAPRPHRASPDPIPRFPRAPRGAMYPGGGEGPAFGLSQQPGEAEGSLTLEVQGRAGSSPDNDGTGRHRQTARARQARRKGVTRVNQWLNPLKTWNRLQPGGCGPGQQCTSAARRVRRLRSR